MWQGGGNIQFFYSTRAEQSRRFEKQISGRKVGFQREAQSPVHDFRLGCSSEPKHERGSELIGGGAQCHRLNGGARKKKLGGKERGGESSISRRRAQRVRKIPKDNEKTRKAIRRKNQKKLKLGTGFSGSNASSI